jgi:hypothetical protein
MVTIGLTADMITWLQNTLHASGGKAPSASSENSRHGSFSVLLVSSNSNLDVEVAHALHLTAGCTSLLLRLAAAATNWHMQPQTSQCSP